MSSLGGMLVDPPRTLPHGDYLSASSVRLYLSCPEKWRRRYLLGEYEPSSGSVIVGNAVHKAEGQHYQHKLDVGRNLLVADVLDAYSDEFEYAKEEASDRAGIDWGEERPGRVKDSGARVLGLYHRQVARLVVPSAVERRFTVELPGVDWTFQGYFDLETGEGPVVDLKVRGATKGVVSAEEAAADVAVTGYTFARKAEGAASWPLFDFHSLVRAETCTPRHVLITPTKRSIEQLEAFERLLYRVATEIAWRTENDVWTPAPPGSWWCSDRYCGFWRSCPFGGAHRNGGGPGPRPLRKPKPTDMLDAVDATLRRDGTTTAERVGRHVGVSTRSASLSLSAAARRGELTSARPSKRGQETRGPLVYGRPETTTA